MRDEKEGRKKQGQTNKKAKQHSTPKAVTFLEPTTLYMYVIYIYIVVHTHTHTHTHTYIMLTFVLAAVVLICSSSRLSLLRAKLCKQKLKVMKTDTYTSLAMYSNAVHHLQDTYLSSTVHSPCLRRVLSSVMSSRPRLSAERCRIGEIDNNYDVIPKYSIALLYIVSFCDSPDTHSTH